MVHQTFRNAKRFNQDISAWDMSTVWRANHLFWGAAAFNQPIGKWNTTAMNETAKMFEDATAFNQDLSNWTATPKDCTDFAKGATAWVAQYGAGSASPPLGKGMVPLCQLSA